MLGDKKKFIRISCLFLIYFILLFLLINFVYNKYIYNDNELAYNEEQFIKNFNETIKVLVVGDSRVSTAINPTYIDNLYNYAIPGDIYSQIYYKVRNILNNSNELEVIVLPYDLQSFSKYREGTFSNVRFWMHSMNINEIAEEVNRPISAVYLNNLFPFIGNGRDFINISFTSRIHTEKIKGWIRHEQGDYWEMSKIEKERDGYNRAREHLKQYPDIINTNLFNSFIKILDLAKQKNKQVVLIKYPVAEYYIKGMERVGLDRNDYYNELNSHITIYDNIIILDYQEKYEDKWFVNSDHFHHEGAEIFSKELNIVFDDILQ